MRMTLKNLIIGFFVVMGGLLITASVLGHHAFSGEFDSRKPVKLRGTVVKMQWINPHAWLHIAVKDENGESVEWMIEAGPPGALVRRGWRRDSVEFGTELLVEGYQAIDGSNRANGREVTFPDGRRLFAGSSGTGAPLDGADPTETDKE